MIRKLFLIALAVFGLIWLARRSRRAPRQRARPAGARGKMVRDRICETFIPIDTALSVTRNGQVHYFCSETCLRRFGASADQTRKHAV